MSAPAAFQATYSDFKIVRGRKCAQIVLELPLEAADAALAALGGVPRPDAEIWVAVARIDPTKAASTPAKPSDAPPKERRRFETLPLSQQAAMRCQEGAFAKFLKEPFMSGRGDSSDPATFVRGWCGVASRADLIPGTRAADKWRKLEDRYQTWLADA